MSNTTHQRSHLTFGNASRAQDLPAPAAANDAARLADINATNVNAAGAVMETDYGALTLLVANANATPIQLPMGNATMVGRQTGGNITAIPQVSGGEITAGTETALRGYSPADLVNFVSTHGGAGGSTDLSARNETGSTLNKGTMVYLSGYSTGTSQALLSPASGLNETAANVVGFMKANLGNGTTSSTAVQTMGFLGGLDTSAYAQGDGLWPSVVTAGGWQNYPGPFAKKAAIVAYSHASSGVILILPSANVFQSGLSGAGMVPLYARTLSVADGTINMDGIFSGGYPMYRIAFNAKVGTDGAVPLVMLRDATPADVSGTYYTGFQFTYLNAATAGGTTSNQSGATGYKLVGSSGVGNAGQEMVEFVLDIMPAQTLTSKSLRGHGVYYNPSGDMIGHLVEGNVETATAIKGISIRLDTGSFAIGSSFYAWGMKAS